ncbi:MAG: histidine phosphatase family protein [Bacteroidota bacterium]
MKTIIFVRHGKSSWDYQVDDKDRPLKERGVNDAHLVAGQLKKMEMEIDWCFSSPANRALHTCMIFLRNLNFDFSKFKVSRDLYDFSGDSVLNFLKNLNGSYSNVMIFGHNYAFTSLVNMLGDAYIDNLPTSGMAILEFNIEGWSGLKRGTTKQITFPKELR